MIETIHNPLAHPPMLLEILHHMAPPQRLLGAASGLHQAQQTTPLTLHPHQVEHIQPSELAPEGEVHRTHQAKATVADPETLTALFQ
jgi:hypothetical protein